MGWSVLISTVSSIENPLVVVAIVSMVAMVVVGQCVRYVCQVLSRKEGGK